MEKSAYTPDKGRLETIDLRITEENTTWFDDCRNHDIQMITDFDGDLVIQERSFNYPLRVYEILRADIGFDPQKNEKYVIVISGKHGSTGNGMDVPAVNSGRLRLPPLTAGTTPHSHCQCEEKPLSEEKS